MDLLIAIPVKPFGVAKARLRPVLDALQRSRLGQAIAAHTVALAVETGAKVAVVTGDKEVAEWTARQGVEVIGEGATRGLNAAAGAAIAVAQNEERGWAILHADLPLLEPDELKSALAEWQPGRVVIAPSYNGGTSLVVGDGLFPFAYGPSSFHRHLASAADRARVVISRGLALDLDSPRDLETALLIKPALAMTWHAASR